MTWSAAGADRSAAPTAPSPRRTRFSRALASALLGAVILGGLAGAYAGTRTEPVTATALVLSVPDPDALVNLGGASSGDPAARNETYLEGELALITQGDLDDRVAAAVGGSVPTITASRVGQSNLVSLSVTADDAERAVRETQAAAEIYVQDRQQQLTTRIETAIATVDREIAQISTQLSASGPQPELNALSTQYSTLLVDRDALQRALGDASSIARTVQRAKPEPRGVISPLLLAVIGGAALGALLGLLISRIPGSLGSRIREEADVSRLGAPVFTPALPTRHGTRNATAIMHAVHLQSLLMPAGPAHGGSLTVLAADREANTTVAAVAHARHAARRRRTLLVCATSLLEEEVAALGVDPAAPGLADLSLPAGPGPASTKALDRVIQSTDVPGLFVIAPGAASGRLLTRAEDLLRDGFFAAVEAAGWAVVVDSAPLDESDIGLLAARHSSELALVVRLGRTKVDDAHRTLKILRIAGVRLSGVLVDRPARLRRRGRRPAAVVQQPARTAPQEQIQGA